MKSFIRFQHPLPTRPGHPAAGRTISASPLHLAWTSQEEGGERTVAVSPEGVLLCRAGTVLQANATAARLLGAKTPGDLAGRKILPFIDPAFRAGFVEQAAFLGMSGFQEQVWQRVDGSRFQAEIGLSGLYVAGRSALRIAIRDISTRKRLQALQSGQNRILSMIATGADLKSVLHEIARFAERQARGSLCSILTLDPVRGKLVDPVAPSLPLAYLEHVTAMPVGPRQGSCGTATFRGEPVTVADIRSDPLWEAWRPFALESGLRACTAWPISGRNGKILGSFALYFRKPAVPAESDVELFSICTWLAGIAMERHAEEQRILRLAYYDGLTGLPNRFLFREYLELALQRAQHRGGRCAILFLDLDRFKEINDSLGHDAGDHALCEIAGRLRQSLRGRDKVARMGGDEFYVLLDALENTQDAAEVARKLVAAAARPLQIGAQRHVLGASVGIALFPQDGTDAQTLLKHADDAMYHAKAAGRNTYRFHTQESAATIPPNA